MKSIDVGRDFSGQLAGGHILNVGICPGKDNCPHERSEAERQREFEKLTERLLTDLPAEAPSKEKV